MRVLMLGWEFPPNISGGLGTACFGITKGLAENGVDTVFVIPRKSGLENQSYVRIHGLNRVPSAAVPGVDTVTWNSLLRPYLSPQQYEEEFASGDAKSGEREDNGFEFWGGYGKNLFEEVARYPAALESYVKKEKFDVIHAHDWMTFEAGAFVKELTGRPLVCHVHACEYDRNGHEAHPWIHRIEQAGLHAADRIVCVSEFLADVLKASYMVDATKLRVVHNAIIPAAFRPIPFRTRTSAQPLVMFLGRMTRQKGPDYFLDAAALVVRHAPRTRFLMCGSGDLLPDMVERAARLGLAKHVIFTGFLEPHEVRTALSQADLFVMPSVSEPFGLVCLEALAARIPILLSRQSGMAELLRFGVKFNYWDVEDLANKILGILRHPELGDHLRTLGKEDLRQFGWKQQGRVLLNIYRELAA